MRVRAQFDNGLQTDWSDYVQYDVASCHPVTSAQLRPRRHLCPRPGTPRPSGRRTVQDVVFDWDPVQGAKQYEIWVARTTTSTTRSRSEIVIARATPRRTTYDNGNYFWKVRAINAADQPLRGPPRRARSSGAARLADRCVPAGPRDPRSADDLYFQWTPVQHATRYQLDVGTDAELHAGHVLDVLHRADDVRRRLQGRTTRACRSRDSLTYWRVRAIDDPTGVEGIYSDADPIEGDNQGHKLVYDAGTGQPS